MQLDTGFEKGGCKMEECDKGEQIVDDAYRSCESDSPAAF